MWDAGGRSIKKCTGDCELTFAVSDILSGTICGISSVFPNVFPNNKYAYPETSVEYGFYTRRGSDRVYVQPVELGASVSAQAIANTGSTLTIRRKKWAVTYLVDGVVVYESRRPSRGTIEAVATLFKPKDFVI